MNWTAAALSDHYRRIGSPNPITDACGEGRSKYRAQPTVVDGIRFASAAESRAYQTLKIAEAAGFISNLELQPRYRLQDAFRDAAGRHRAIDYVGDFRFVREGKTVVVEIKGFATAAWLIKEKLMRAKFPEVTLEVWHK